MGPRLPISLQQLPQHVLSHLIDMTRHQAHPAGLPVGVVAVVDELEEPSPDLRLMPVDLLLVTLLSQLHTSMCHVLPVPCLLAQLLEKSCLKVKLLPLPTSLHDDDAGLQEARRAHVNQRSVLVLPIRVLDYHILRVQEEESIGRLDCELDLPPLCPADHCIRHPLAHPQLLSSSGLGEAILLLPVSHVNQQSNLHCLPLAVARQVPVQSSRSLAPPELG
mmetsp:Transcript_30101/g.96835  ORF Transcript_30101/g.96835 Transcript_30101/m.96835 type:complete len:220 (+) Transcript_30101:1760-2419(+)